MCIFDSKFLHKIPKSSYNDNQPHFTGAQLFTGRGGPFGLPLVTAMVLCLCSILINNTVFANIKILGVLLKHQANLL